jgi:cation-transporting ATPase 13A2
MNFKFAKELKVFLFFMIIIYIVSLGCFTYINLNHMKAENKNKEESGKIISRAIDLLTVVVPPSLYICIRWTSFYFTEILHKNNITCLSEKRLHAAGKVNTIVLDKTGTLTEDGIDIFGFQTTKKIYIDEKYNEDFYFKFDNIHKDLKNYDSMHMEFWSRFASSEKKSKDENFYYYQTDLKNNPVFFIECLASCLSIDKLRDNKILGNNIDKKIFEYLDWNLEKSYEKFEEFDINYILKPSQNYIITEDLVFKKSNSNKKNPQYLLKIIKKFEFSSKYQSNSVIIKNELDGSFRFFIKGAPEKIRDICIKESLPNDFDDVLENHSKKGFRVLACATKVLTEDDISNNLNEMENDKNFRLKFEEGLFFLGFIILSNKLKPITTSIIKVLNESNSNLIMATGDNPFTSISVANECKMINSESKICLIDFDKINQKID